MEAVAGLLQQRPAGGPYSMAFVQEAVLPLVLQDAPVVAAPAADDDGPVGELGTPPPSIAPNGTAAAP